MAAKPKKLAGFRPPTQTELTEPVQLMPEHRRLTIERLISEWARDLEGESNLPFVFVNMISTVDGKTTKNWATRELGSEIDLDLLLELRTVADAVIVGPRTLAIENYGPLIRGEARRQRRADKGLSETPPLVLITRSFNVAWEAPLFADPKQSVFVYTTAGRREKPKTAATVEIISLADLSPRRVLEHLGDEKNVQRLLCEGGPTFNGALWRESLVDELFLTIAPLTGGNSDELSTIVDGASVPTYDLKLEWVLEYQNELFLRYSFVRPSPVQ